MGLCWKQAVRMVRCFSVRTVRPRLERPLPGPRPRPRPPGQGDEGEDLFLCPPVAPMSSSLSCPANRDKVGSRPGRPSPLLLLLRPVCKGTWRGVWRRLSVYFIMLLKKCKEHKSWKNNKKIKILYIIDKVYSCYNEIYVE